MNLLDIIVLVLLAYNAISGLRKGLFRMGFELLGLVSATLVAFQFYEEGAIFLQTNLAMSATLASFLGFTSIWGMIFLCFTAMGKAFHNNMRLTIMWPINRLGGAIAGASRGFFYLLPFLIPLAHSNAEIYHNSEIAKPLNNLVSERIQSSEKAQTLLESFKKKNKEETESMQERISNDPQVQELQEALESGSAEELSNILERIEE